MQLPAGALSVSLDNQLNNQDFAWLVSRFLTSDSPVLGQDSQSTPGWSGVNALMRSKVEVRWSVIGYLPVLPHSPTEMSTVFELLQRSVAIANRIG